MGRSLAQDAPQSANPERHSRICYRSIMQFPAVILPFVSYSYGRGELGTTFAGWRAIVLFFSPLFSPFVWGRDPIGDDGGRGTCELFYSHVCGVYPRCRAKVHVVYLL